MPKFCVFCGAPPTDKNREHVLPRWLLELTGDPSRRFSLGYDRTVDPPREISFSFSNFTLPACTRCNSNFSELEALAKAVILTVLRAGELTHTDLEILLDWLDKVRIGLWLAHYQLANNPFGIVPKYHISSRIGKKDRFAAIYRSSSKDLGLWFTATDNPLFYHSPTCFCLTVNNVSFQSASTDFMLSRRLGFPHPKKLFARDSNFKLEVEMQPGRERIMHPPLRAPLFAEGTAFYQCIFTSLSDSWDRESFEAAYDTPYVRSRSSNWDAGRARIVFAPIGEHVQPYPDTASTSWVPKHSWDQQKLMRKLALQTLELQATLLETDVDVCQLESAQQRSIQFQIGLMLGYHRKVIAELKRDPSKGSL